LLVLLYQKIQQLSGHYPLTAITAVPGRFDRLGRRAPGLTHASIIFEKPMPRNITRGQAPRVIALDGRALTQIERELPWRGLGPAWPYFACRAV
jgi:hypothetical protein